MTDEDKDRESLNSFFYNVQADIFLDGRLQNRNIAIRNIWEKEDNLFLDIYLYDEQKSLIVDAVFIKKIINLNNNKVYLSREDFLRDFEGYKETKKEDPIELRNAKGLKYLKQLGDDLIILSFIANHHIDLSEIKIFSIEDYITQIKPEARALSSNYIRNYIMELSPTEENFYEALENIKSKTPQEAINLFQECVKLCYSDGYLDYKERLYLAEIMQTLREYNVSLKGCLI